MGLVSGNRLNRFWQKGVKPIKDAIGVLSALSTVDKTTLVAAVNELAEGKVDIAKIVASTNITEPGFLMDGKTTADALAELNSNMIIFRRSISPGEDLNDIITPGLYSIYSSAAPQVKNLPINSACVIEILVSSEYIIQKEYSLSASKTRFRSSDKWFDWY